MRITKKQREGIYDKYGGRCSYCGDELQKGWHIDHIEPILRRPDGSCDNPENENFDNLTPSCPSCNILKGRNTLEGFRRTIQEFTTTMSKYIVQYKFAKRYGLLRETYKQVEFYFEKTNHE